MEGTIAWGCRCRWRALPAGWRNLHVQVAMGFAAGGLVAAIVWRLLGYGS